MVRYVGSQWLAMPPVAARWLMDDKALVPKYWRYAKHIVVADENFLPTMFRNSPFCAHHVTSNLVHVQVCGRLVFIGLVNTGLHVLLFFFFFVFLCLLFV